jgi:hypothetical protein
MKTWSEAATKSVEAFKRGDNAMLLKDVDTALLCFAESRAWLEIAMHRISREAYAP